ncbi:hypothetical protein GS399_10475 [Pedobacter sp. HMF7647]|uniref:Copper resistance protein NlpE n=1 Tax=Hufsiella arboris TaxID=2695275 RepID=A0A7K1Y9Y7_9SPHI|nr:copper resistance protein NlpE [Hufsiella arboris]MXV51395.1 hypothetical protein [Hufsiella arboris]
MKISHVLFLFAALVIASCGKKKVQLKANPEKYALTHPDSVNKKVIESYSGTIPCADCEGIKTTLNFYADNTFLMEDIYLGKNSTPFRSTGHYNIERGYGKDNNASLFVLNDSIPEKKKFYVRYSAKPNRLFMLDRDAKPIQSKMEFVLKRLE